MPAGFNSREILTLLGFILFFVDAKIRKKPLHKKENHETR